jgi:hypothetical protein
VFLFVDWFFVYFWDRVLLILPGLASNSWSSYLCILQSWNYRCMPHAWLI